MPIIKQRQYDLSDTQFTEATPALLQQIYAARGVLSDQDAQHELKDLLPPQLMKGWSQAAAIIADHIVQQKHILIVGDFDCDGATSSAVAVSALADMGAKFVDFLVPNRFEYGYGLTPEIVQVAKQKNPDLIITVDNGISSIDGVATANQLGIQVVVTDHHLAGQHLPEAAAIVNPNQPGCDFPSKNLAGVGVIFYVMSGVRAQLRERNWFATNNIVEPNMAEYLDLVALGTVADVVPLDKNNRILVAQGIGRIRSGRVRPGIKALLEVANRSLHRLVAADFGFAIGPRLNAAGRLDDMSIGIQCLLAANEYSARELAQQMDELNHDRRAIESGMQQEAMRSLAKISLDDSDMPYGLCLYQADWHQGVIGILASRIKDHYHRPVIVFADAEDDGGPQQIKGSARSIVGLHIRDALDAVAAKHPHLLSKFGGHSMAAGMSLYKEHYPDFARAFDAEVRRQLSEDDLQAVLLTDGELSPQDFQLELAQQLRDAGPWGQHFPEPLFEGELYLVQQRIVGEKHLKLVLSTEPQGGQLIDAIAFNIDIKAWPNNAAKKAKLVYKLDVNEFRGNQSLQLMVDYIEAL
ncbi:single-stranded-DNA-specific exonuclease RecJ [Dasania sp. GY-MA-18]|uniref:Single-stranded-DNA-specific exonuclease RecJ n=1 Tax=Dasania phycosphaerae TaxID=2950436 RepID=A0A9J6RLE3_9GAMM|nr:MULTISPECIES: single-stranded-DNA-specific exonuclease RecJ [Dasania]MCR8922715.1 single-stranded-DNA-specific exonuclease RecJ [Dasania sp. GY-MA-18]MCZ0865145.1 single-stranded-DNA-specific exonuclease RecJ [Dasania phycosphaerae]MCZ0868871.1 single-stranded-DNA-specific exonuclease RecJ [Dasania phycosphaerae]